MKTLHAITWCVVVVACSNGSENITEDTSAYNARIDEGIRKNACWVQSPVEIATHLFGPHEHERSFFLSYQVRDEDIRVEVTLEGLQDDSVFGERRTLTFQQTDGRWVIKEIHQTVRCREGRGHDDYSSEPCS